MVDSDKIALKKVALAFFSLSQHLHLKLSRKKFLQYSNSLEVGTLLAFISACANHESWYIIFTYSLLISVHTSRTRKSPFTMAFKTTGKVSR